MRRGQRITAAVCLGALLLAGCGSAVSTSVAGQDAEAADAVMDDHYGTTYEIFVYSFADSDGDGIGDLRGITENIDYLNDGDPKAKDDLGVNALWLTPIFPSPTYHKYDATDYCSIDPDFGTMDDFDTLLAACHERGMKLYLDLAFNHTSDAHPWFVQAADYLCALPKDREPSEEECACFDYYNFSREQKPGYEPLAGADGWYYEARFWSGMPDLNLDSKAVRKEISEIVGWWLNRGVDGFRLDAVTSYYTDDEEKNRDFLAWLTGTAHAMAPDVYFVGEAWENQSAYAKLYAGGVDSLFDFDFAGTEGVIAQTVRSGKNAKKFAGRMAEEEALYASYGSDFINAPFYTNHDMARSAGYYSKDGKKRIKLAMAMNLLQTGNAFLYYGEELGMRGSGKDENKRAPFAWISAQGADAGTKGSAAAMDALCAGPPDMDDFDAAPYGSLEEQREDPYSVYNYVREAVHLRARHPLIARGKTVVVQEGAETEAESDEHPAVCFFLRKGDADDDTLWIYVNTGAEPQTIALGNGEGDVRVLSDSLTVDEERVELTAAGGRVKSSAPFRGGDTLYLPGYAIAVLK